MHLDNGQHRRAVFARCRHQGLKAPKQLCWTRHIAICAIIYKCNIAENANAPATPNKIWQPQASARQPPDLVNLTTQQTPNIDLAPPLDASIATLPTSSVKSSNYILQRHPFPSTLSRKAKVDKMAKNSKTMTIWRSTLCSTTSARQQARRRYLVMKCIVECGYYHFHPQTRRR